MNLHNWKIFNKSGSPINWYADPYINLSFKSSLGKDAEGYLITDFNKLVVNTEITNSGYLYDADTSALYTYTFGDENINISGDVSLIYTDVSIFNPTLTNTLGISDIVGGLLNFDGVDDTVILNSTPDVTGNKTVSFYCIIPEGRNYSGSGNEFLFGFQSGSTSDDLIVFLQDQGTGNTPEMCINVSNTATNNFNFSIINMIGKLMFVEIDKGTEVLNSVKVNGIEMTGNNNSVWNANNGKHIGSRLGTNYYFKGLLWNLIINDEAYWKGYSNGSQNSGWSDQISSNDGSILGLPNSANFLGNDSSLPYPSVTYSSALFLNPVSKGLVETEHLFIFEQYDSSYIRPYDSLNSSFAFKMVGDESEIRLFSIDEDKQEVEWTDTLYYDLDEWRENTPITLNIGFKSDEEGVYERKLIFYHIIDGDWRELAEILVNAQSIGEDERFRTLLGNFGLPDPKEFPKLFKETDINEDLPDYQVVNSKSKQMILEHAQIIPYIGTYKALINAIKWLGYEDIYIREWFKNVKENTKLSLIIPYNAKDRTQTILKFSPAERKVLKKLNQLSLNYCITKDTGEIDEWGTPTTENCYEYNIQEIFIKLLSLKKWLEKNIIGVNARIIDLTGDGVYYERFKNTIYSTQNIGYSYTENQSLTPVTTPKTTELILGEASIAMTLMELSRTKIENLPYKFSDFVDYVWNPNDPSLTLSQDASSYIEDSSNYLTVGPPISFPLMGIKDIVWKASVKTGNSGVVGNPYVTNPLWIYDNSIKFYDIFDTSSHFFDTSTNLKIILERAVIRDADSNNWFDSSLYSIYPNYDIQIDASVAKILYPPGNYIITSGSGLYIVKDTSVTYSVAQDPCLIIVGDDSSIYFETTTVTNVKTPNIKNYIMEDLSIGTLWLFNDFVHFDPSLNAVLQFAEDASYRVPLLSFKNFTTIDTSLNDVSLGTDKLYHLDILDGKIEMDSSIYPDNSKLYINFEFDVEKFNTDYNKFFKINKVVPFGTSSIGVEVFGDMNKNPFNKNEYVYLKTKIYDIKAKVTNIFQSKEQIEKKLYYVFLETFSRGYDGGGIISTYPIPENTYRSISLNVEYTSARQPLYVIDPSIYYWADPSKLNGGNNPNVLVIDNSIYTMTVNHIGNYNIELFARDGYNNLFYNPSLDNHIVRMQSPTINTLIDNSCNQCDVCCSSTFIFQNDVSNIINSQLYPIYDRLQKFEGISLEDNYTTQPYIKVPAITYFQTIPNNNLIAKFYNLTSKVTAISGNDITISSSEYQYFLDEDDVQIVKFYNGNYSKNDEASSHISSISGQTFTMDQIPIGYNMISPSTNVYLLNDTHRSTGNIINDLSNNNLTLNITNYTYNPDQLVTLVITDASTSYDWAASYKVLSSDGSTHTLDNIIPQQFIDEPRYIVEVKQAFSTYVNYLIDVSSALKVNGDYRLYLKDIDNYQSFLDNTFTLTYITSNHEKVEDQWYDPLYNLNNSSYYYHPNPIRVDSSTLVILTTLSDPSSYFLNQKNVWTVRKSETKDLEFKVYNKDVPFMFDASGHYDIEVETYDSYGNLGKNTYEGLILIQ